MAKKTSKKGTKLNRRNFIKKASQTGITASAAWPFLENKARAQTQDPSDDHLFLFIQLFGGTHFATSIDAPRLSKLALNDETQIITHDIDKGPPTKKEFQLWDSKFGGNLMTQEGYNMLLPYVGGDLKSSYQTGKTGLGCDYSLGFAAGEIKNNMDDIGIIRGVHMIGNFHPAKEIFGAHPEDPGAHIAGVLSKHLEKRYGPKLLDNLALEGSTYPVTVGGRMPIRADFLSLGSLAAGASSASGNLFKSSRILTEAFTGTDLSSLQKSIVSDYVSAMTTSKKVGEKLSPLSFGGKDLSLDLKSQLEGAVTLFQSGLSRVLTLGFGANNGQNNVDGFGIFDSHQGVYHADPNGGGLSNSFRHHVNVEKTMNTLAEFIEILKKTNYTNTDKKLIDMITVVVGTDYSRPSNLSGNEFSVEELSDNDPVYFGNGHNQWNNNYMFFGKNVNGGMIVGQTEDVSHSGDYVKADTLESDKPEDIVYKRSFTMEQNQGSGSSGSKRYIRKWGQARDPERPILVQDVLKTVMGFAGLDKEFDKTWSRATFPNPKNIKMMKKTRS